LCRLSPARRARRRAGGKIPGATARGGGGVGGGGGGENGARVRVRVRVRIRVGVRVNNTHGTHHMIPSTRYTDHVIQHTCTHAHAYAHTPTTICPMKPLYPNASSGSTCVIHLYLYGLG